jgi:hypothetical protein
MFVYNTCLTWATFLTKASSRCKNGCGKGFGFLGINQTFVEGAMFSSAPTKLETVQTEEHPTQKNKIKRDCNKTKYCPNC